MIYQEVDDLQAAITEGTSIDQLDMSCFTGEYVTGTVTEEYLALGRAHAALLTRVGRSPSPRAFGGRSPDAGAAYYSSMRCVDSCSTAIFLAALGRCAVDEQGRDRAERRAEGAAHQQEEAEHLALVEAPFDPGFDRLARTRT